MYGPLEPQSVGGHSLAGSPATPDCMAWFYRKDGKIQVSLRSGPDGRNVREIAQRYGGGGHDNASGLEVEADVHPFFDSPAVLAVETGEAQGDAKAADRRAG